MSQGSNNASVWFSNPTILRLLCASPFCLSGAFCHVHRTSGSGTIRDTIETVLQLFPTPTDIVDCSDAALKEALRPAGLQDVRCKSLKEMSRSFLLSDWSDPSEVLPSSSSAPLLPAPLLPSSPPPLLPAPLPPSLLCASSPQRCPMLLLPQFYGCGRFVSDSWSIFCRGNREVKTVQDETLRRYLRRVNQGAAPHLFPFTHPPLQMQLCLQRTSAPGMAHENLKSSTATIQRPPMFQTLSEQLISTPPPPPPPPLPPPLPFFVSVGLFIASGPASTTEEEPKKKAAAAATRKRKAKAAQSEQQQEAQGNGSGCSRRLRSRSTGMNKHDERDHAEESGSRECRRMLRSGVRGTASRCSRKRKKAAQFEARRPRSALRR